MSSPAPGSAPQPIACSTPAERRLKLAKKWAYLVSLTAYLPGPHADLVRELFDLVERVFEAVTSAPLPTDRIAAIGARLVEVNCVGRASLRCSMDVLADGLLSEPELSRLDRLPERVAHVLSALASGYAEAMRWSTMEQQDKLHRALLEALWKAEWQRRISESRLSEVLTRSASGIAITDLDGRLISVNAAFDRIVGRHPGKTGQVTLFDLLRPQHNLDLRGTYRALRDGDREQLALHVELLDRDGEPVAVSLTASLLRDPDGHASEYVTFIIDDS